MIDNKDVTFVKQTLDVSDIGKILGLCGKYYDAFVDLTCWTYRNTDSDVWLNSKFQRIGNFIIKVGIVLGGAFVSCLKYKLKYRKYRSDELNSSLIAIPFGGAYVRYKYIYDFLGDNVTVHYPPLFHFQYIDAHIQCFKDQNKGLSIDGFSLRNILSVLIKIVRNYRILKECHHKIDAYFERKYGYFISAVVTVLLYKKYINHMLRILPNDNTSRKWLFDYDFDYKYIIFNNEIKKLRKNDVTFHIHHGSFYDYNDAYCNSVSDVSICCSERERRIIEKYNKYGSKIFAQGSSWQSIDRSCLMEQVLSNYDILVLLNATFEEQYASYQKMLLTDLSKLNVSVLVRYRPQSAELDKAVLQEYTKGMTVSEGTSLKKDILSSRVVVCFSEDAVFECFRNNKKVCFLVLDLSCYDMTIAKSTNMYIMSPQTYSCDCIKQCLDGTECDYSNDTFVRFNFGDFEFNRVKENLNLIIKQC